MMKYSHKLEIELNLFNFIKGIYEKKPQLTSTEWSKTKCSPLRPGTRQCPLLPLVVSTVLEVLAGATGQAKEIKDI